MTDKLIAEAIGKLDGQNIAHGCLAGVQMHRAIGIRRLEPGMADQLGAVLGLFVAAKPSDSARSRAFWARSSLTSSST